MLELIKAGGWVPMSGYFDDYSQTHGMPLGWIPAGEQTLDGNQALWYGRSREYVDDYARIARAGLRGGVDDDRSDLLGSRHRDLDHATARRALHALRGEALLQVLHLLTHLLGLLHELR